VAEMEVICNESVYGNELVKFGKIGENVGWVARIKELHSSSCILFVRYVSGDELYRGHGRAIIFYNMYNGKCTYLACSNSYSQLLTFVVTKS
jgi:hypothetical protein